MISCESHKSGLGAFQHALDYITDDGLTSAMCVQFNGVRSWSEWFHKACAPRPAKDFMGLVATMNNHLSRTCEDVYWANNSSWFSIALIGLLGADFQVKMFVVDSEYFDLAQDKKY